MIRLVFTDCEIKILKYEKDSNAFKDVRKRCQIVYLKSQGYSHKKIGEIVGVCQKNVTTTLQSYKEGGIEAVKTRNYKGQPSKLYPYTNQIKASFDEKPVGTLKEASAQIENITGIKLSLTQIACYLDQVGIKRRKVKQMPDKVDLEAQETFKTETLDPLIERAKNKQIHLFAVDAAHFVLKPFLGFLYSFRVIFTRASAGRKRLNVLGALNMITKQVHTFTNETYINSESVCVLMDEVATVYTDAPIYFLLDNARYQKNQFVKDHAANLGINLVYLPPYSPNLNLIERLWKFIKKKALYNEYYDNFSKFKIAILNCVDNCNTLYQDELCSLLTLKFQTFENAKIKP